MGCVQITDDGITVSTGQILIESIDCIRSDDTVLILEANLHSKRPDVYRTITEKGVPVVHMWADPESTLNYDGTTRSPTEIILPDKTRDWVLFTDEGRYTVRIIAYRNTDEERTTVWRDCD